MGLKERREGGWGRSVAAAAAVAAAAEIKVEQCERQTWIATWLVSAGNWQQLLITKQKQQLTTTTTTATATTTANGSIQKGYQTAEIKTNRQLKMKQ